MSRTHAGSFAVLPSSARCSGTLPRRANDLLLLRRRRRLLLFPLLLILLITHLLLLLPILRNMKGQACTRELGYRQNPQHVDMRTGKAIGPALMDGFAVVQLAFTFVLGLGAAACSLPGA